MNSIKILGTGQYTPEKKYTNADIEKMVDTSDEWITSRTGIKERRIAPEGVSTSDLAIKAAKAALKSSKLKAEDIDLIIVATATPDMIFPSTACLVQAGINAENAAAFDISAVCSGFIFGLSTAEQYLKSGKYKNILLIGSETMSHITDWTDRSTCVLFGDGAGAVVLQRNEKNDTNIFYTNIQSDGNHARLLCVPGGGSRHPISANVIEEKLHYIKMDGNKIFKLAVKGMARIAVEALEHNNISIKDVDLIIPHQANLRILEGVGNRLNIPPEKFFVNVQKYGNTSAASIPIALNEAYDDELIKEGSLVLMLAFGAGLTWGSALIRC